MNEKLSNIFVREREKREEKRKERKRGKRERERYQEQGEILGGKQGFSRNPKSHQ